MTAVLLETLKTVLAFCIPLVVWVGLAFGVFWVVKPWYLKWYERLGRHPTLADVVEGDLFALFRKPPKVDDAMGSSDDFRNEFAEQCRALEREPSEEAERRLLEWMGEVDGYKRSLVRAALARRYRAGICHEDPGPELTPEEQRDLNWKIYCMERADQLVSFVLGDGMDQLLTSRQRNEWEEAIEGMELVGAVKRARACREVLKMFKQAMRPGRREDVGYEMVKEIQSQNASRYAELEDGIGDASEWGLDDEYVIRHRTLFLRNRGDRSWEGLGMRME
jgi:hypothetical protein